MNKLLISLAVATLCLLISTVTLAALHSSSCRRNQLESKPEMILSRNSNTSVKNIAFRLPRHIIPTNYKLHLRPNTTNKTFKGTVTISLQVTLPCKKITLHSKQLNIKGVNFKDINNNDLKLVRAGLVEDKRELMYVQLEDMAPKGNHSLTINFDGRLDQGIVGFYYSTLKNGKAMVASKFQPTYARQAFPCFDEPDFKATYDITLVKPTTHVALSNMNEISKTLDEETGTEAVTFATSVPMSTYLACFVVCDFHYKETEIRANGIGKNFKLRSFAQKDEIHKIDFAQDIGKRATEFYIKYYEVPFPLPKLDMIAIPDYVSGATEHWGLITYRETSFLIDEATASSKNKIGVANTIAHELAHMWFGNLVTMKWWDEIWLNEGFATYMQVKALNALEPSWTMLDQFLTKTLHSVLVTDAKQSSHPIVQTVATPDQITAIFDTISYNKGSSILRMLEGFIGEENFRKGVSDYLKKYEFGNTITQDLLASLEPYFKKDNPSLNLAYIMDTWTRQQGYPMLNVSKGDQPDTFVITQKRFLLDPDTPTKNDSDFNYRWCVPITYKTNNGPNNQILWFADKDENVILSLRADDAWVKINNNQVGFYRVNYPLDMWHTLIKQLKEKSPQLTISDRAHLINDVFALAEAREVPYSLALDLTAYLTVEEDYVPWETAATTLLGLADRLRNTMAYDDLMKYIQRLILPLYNKQTWEKTRIGVIEGLLRTRILSLATRAQLPQAQAKVREMFLNWLHKRGTADVTAIEPDLRDFVYKYGMKPATMEEWVKLWEIYLKEQDAHEASKLRAALAAPSDLALLRKYLLLAWDEKNIRSQDYLNVLQYISSNPSGTALVWDDVRARWPELVDRFTLNSRYLGALIPAVTASFSTPLKLNEMEDFFGQYPEAGAGEAARRRALENVRNNIHWAEQHQKEVTDWLRQHQA